jgi:hypothetical protein
LLYCGNLPRGLQWSRLATKRGRWGNKPAETLQFLQAVPPPLFERQPLQVRGALRSVAAALNDLMPPGDVTDDLPILCWLAIELGLNGHTAVARLKQQAQDAGWGQPALPSGNTSPLIELGGMLFWRVFLDREVARLTDALTQPRHRNPFRAELSACIVGTLLEMPQPALARAVLERFAASQKLRRTHTAYPVSFRLTGTLPTATAAPDEQAAAEEIRSALATRPGASRRDLATLFPSQQHILAWLYDAEELIELPGWYTISCKQLRTHLATVPAGPGQPVPSVRELKDRLRLGRREAESLRAWYVEHSGLRVNPKEAQAAMQRIDARGYPARRRPWK